jgi:AbrB family looped-hinge helix DNA binding protein
VPVAFGVVMAERGRLVLPVDVRERLNIKPGDRLTLRVEPDGTMKLLTAAAFARSLRGMFKHLGVPGRSIVDDLIAERRREARMEEEDTRAMLARRPRPRLGNLRRAGAGRGKR